MENQNNDVNLAQYNIYSIMAERGFWKGLLLGIGIAGGALYTANMIKKNSKLKIWYKCPICNSKVEKDIPICPYCESKLNWDEVNGK